MTAAIQIDVFSDERVGWDEFRSYIYITDDCGFWVKVY